MGSISTVDNVTTKLMGLPWVFSCFTYPMERKGETAGVGLKDLLAASIHEEKHENASGTTP